MNGIVQINTYAQAASGFAIQKPKPDSGGLALPIFFTAG